MMITYTLNGTTATVPCYSVVSFDWGFSSAPPPSRKLSARPENLNRKFWARLFREFLMEKIPERAMPRIKAYPGVLLPIGRYIRSSPLAAREWKMKLWKQKN